MKEQYRIAAKRSLTPEIGQISVEAPLIAARAKAGQFIILRVDEAGERIPLTISSAQDGKVTVVYQKVGGTTLALDQLQEGDCLHDFVGPLGTPPTWRATAGWRCWAEAWAVPSPCRWPRP